MCPIFFHLIMFFTAHIWTLKPTGISFYSSKPSTNLQPETCRPVEQSDMFYYLPTKELYSRDERHKTTSRLTNGIHMYRHFIVYMQGIQKVFRPQYGYVAA